MDFSRYTYISYYVHDREVRCEEEADSKPWVENQHFFMKTDKDICYVGRRKTMQIKMYNGVRVNNQLYFVCYDMNLLCCWDSTINRMLIVSSAPEEDLFEEGLFGNIIFEDGILYLIPFNANNLWMYNLDGKFWDKIELPANVNMMHKFYGAHIKQNYLYLLGYNYPGILKVNLKTKNIDSLDIDKKIFEKNYISEGFLNWNYCIQGDFLITPILCTNMLLKINLVNDQISYVSIQNSDESYVGIAWDGEKYWLPPRRGNKYLTWDGNQIFEEHSFPKELGISGQYFGGAYRISNNIIFTSFIGDSIRIQTDESENLEKMSQTFLFGKNISPNELLLGHMDGEITWIQNGNEQAISDYIEDEMYREFIKKRVKFRNVVIREQNLLTLEDFVKILNGGNNE